MPHLRTESFLEVAGPVAGSVVGHHRLHGDTDPVEECVGAVPEAGGGVLLLVVKDLGAHQPGVVIDGVVQVPVPA